MLKAYVYGGYKRPREITWMLGVLTFGIVLGFGFTGSLLPWDQLAFWATTVGTQAPASLPVLGDLIGAFMRGGEEVGEATLGRFFLAHVALLPLALVVVVALHLILVRVQGTSPLQRTDEPEPTAEDTLKAGGNPFFPNHILKEGIVAYLTLGILITLAVLAPLHPGAPADPLETPEGIKPEWYFLPMFQLLKYMPEAVAVVLPGVVGLLLFLLPLLDRSPERHPRCRPLAMGIGIAFPRCHPHPWRPRAGLQYHPHALWKDLSFRCPRPAASGCSRRSGGTAMSRPPRLSLAVVLIPIGFVAPCPVAEALAPLSPAEQAAFNSSVHEYIGCEGCHEPDRTDRIPRKAIPNTWRRPLSLRPAQRVHGQRPPGR